MSKAKKALIVLAISLGSLFLIAFIAAMVIGPRMKEITVNQINKQLIVPVKVDDIHFSFIRMFPYASVELKGVSSDGVKLSNASHHLIKAESVFFLFNIWDVLGDDLKLKKISLRNADLNLFISKKGENNFEIFKKDTVAADTSESVKLAIESFELIDVAFHYRNDEINHNYNLSFLNTEFKGAFTSDVYDLKANGDIYVKQLAMNNVNYIDHKNVQLDLQTNINTTTETYSFSNSKMKMESLELSVDGKITKAEKGRQFDLSINSNETTITGLLSLIPGTYSEKLNNYKCDGKVDFKLSVKGIYSENSTPTIVAQFGAKNATMKPNGSDYSLTQISFKGSYKNKISASQPIDQLIINNFSAQIENQPIQANFTIEDFNNPNVNIYTKATLNLEIVSQFYKPDTIESMSGTFTIDGKIAGRVKEKTSWTSEGSLALTGVNFKLKSKAIAFTDFSGNINLTQNRLNVENFKGNIAGSDISLNGNIDNLYGYLLTEQQPVIVNAQFYSRNIDLNEILEDKSTSTASDTTYRLDFDPRINLNMSLNIGMLSFRKFQAWQLKGDIGLHDKVLNTSNLSIKTCEGTLLLDGEMNARDKDSLLITCNANIRQIDMNTLFYQLGNFGQDVITDKNIKGKVTATVQFASVWSKDLHCNMNRIYTQSSLTIENGELNNFEPMLALSKYVKGADFKNIKFSTLKNTIEIKNRAIVIPTMEIKSSAMDLTLSGTHTFDNIVDYHFQLYLSQILGKKVKDMNTEFGTIDDDGLGRIRIYLSMKGPVSSPKITYDKKGFEQNLEKEIIQEKQNFKSIIKDEFGWGKKDSTTTKKQEPKVQQKEELQIEYDN
jgi:hypothetical protein